MLDLYFFAPSTTSQKVRACLFHKGIEVREHPIDLLALEQLGPELLARNPRAEVPVLVADGVALTEAAVINEYLEERFPDPPLLPREPLRRALVRRWIQQVDAGATVAIAQPTFQAWVRPALRARPRSEVAAQLARMPVESHRERWQRALDGGFDDATLARAFEVVDEMFAQMQVLLAERPFLFGAEPTLADLTSLPLLVRCEQLGRAELWRRRARLESWFERMAALPCFAPTYSAPGAASTGA